MGIEWFRDLSITILCFITTVVLIFNTILAYRLYRMIKSTLLLANAASKMAYDTAAMAYDTITMVQEGVRDTITMVQEGIKPLLPILSIIQGIREGFKGISNIFKK